MTQFSINAAMQSKLAEAGIPHESKMTNEQTIDEIMGQADDYAACSSSW